MGGNVNIPLVDWPESARVMLWLVTRRECLRESFGVCSRAGWWEEVKSRCGSANSFTSRLESFLPPSPTSTNYYQPPTAIQNGDC